ncbi:hypothetical protein GCM10007874_38860 [Labrys miyagiensis]|uniref:Uncharacterized protein n=1 Tax=Labrys miyagiensis TaxID=346912 RepID=A0ABQ6CM83_9HYPH|nr:hypothetical protein GCM10007874_38860 [Labrys miyagiensis]
MSIIERPIGGEPVCVTNARQIHLGRGSSDPALKNATVAVQAGLKTRPRQPLRPALADHREIVVAADLSALERDLQPVEGRGIRMSGAER